MILAILQARMSSTRLPGKVLMPILDKPMLEHQLFRLGLAKSINKIVVATSDESSDDAIEALCERIGVSCFRGDLNNVLSRFYHCAIKYQPEQVIRVTGDCPLIDPAVIDEVVATHLQGQFDYTTNAYPFTFPDGLDVEIMRMATLAEVFERAKTAEQFEHVTIFVRQHPEDFNIGQVTCAEDLSAQRWTVDHAEDFTLVSRVFAKLYPENPQFNYQQIMALYSEQPELFSINRQHIK